MSTRRDRDPSPSAPTRTRLARAAYLAGGTLCLALGIIGAFLPVMPTTCFVLLAAWCYARGSERWYRRLLAHRVFGPLIRDWREHRAIPARARVVAIAMIVTTICTSVAVVSIAWVQVMLAAIAVALVAFLLRLPSRESIVAASAA